MTIKRNESDSMRKDIIPLWKGNKHDKADTTPLDIRVKPEYDNFASSSCHFGLRAGIQRDDKLMPKAFRFAESGRSMVEMLGVLAVIGVLSIGGIMGYSYGMDKYRANTTVNDINLRRIDLISQVENGNKNPTSDTWNNEKTLYPMALVFDADSGAPLIQVSNVSEQVCEMIVKDMEKQAAITVNSYYIAGQEDGGCEEQNDLTFYFGDYTMCGTEYCSGNTPICHPDSQTCVACLNSGDCPADTPICNASNMCEPCPDDNLL